MCSITLSVEVYDVGNATEGSQDPHEAREATQDAQDTGKSDLMSCQAGRNGPTSDAGYLFADASYFDLLIDAA